MEIALLTNDFLLLASGFLSPHPLTKMNNRPTQAERFAVWTRPRRLALPSWKGERVGRRGCFQILFLFILSTTFFLALTCPAQISNATPLSVVCPTNTILGFLTETGTVATFTATVTGGCSVATATFTPVSGSLFPIGVTPVSLLVTDACSSVQCLFNVTVLGPRDIKSEMVADLLALQFAADTRTDRRGLNLVIRRLTASLDADFWVDQTHVTTNHGPTVFSQERGAVSLLASLQTKPRSHLAHATLQNFIDQLVASDRLLAAVRIQDAATTSPSSKKISLAREELAKGDKDAANARPSSAISHYKTAWSRVAKL